MKKKTFVIVLVIIVVMGFVLGFCLARGNDDGNNTVVETVSEAQSESVTASSESVTEVVTETETDTTAESTTQKQLKSEIVNTSYFSLTTPDEWYGKYSKKINKYNEDGSYTAIFYHEESRNSNNGGELFMLEVYPVSEDDEAMFDASPVPVELLGILTVKGNQYNVVLSYPSDEQFSADTKEEYNELKDGIDEMVASLTPVDGVDFKVK